MEKETVIRPSLLSADFVNLQRDIDEMVSLGITDCHFDVMDGSFVDDISFGEPLYKKIAKAYEGKIAFDVHLMVINPMKQVRRFIALGAKEISFHYEAMKVSDLIEVQAIRREHPDVRLGLALSPETDVQMGINLANLFDFFLIMSVVPGKGGQSYIQGTENKISRLDLYRKQSGLKFFIGVDGGINDITGPLCYSKGVDYLVAGSYYFSAESREEALCKIRKSLRRDTI